MRTSRIPVRSSRSIVGMIVMALAIASVVVGISLGPALAQERHGPPDRGERRDERHDERYRREYRHHHPVRVYQPPPPQVVYAPPPVVYAPPPPSPGISIFFPIHIR